MPEKTRVGFVGCGGIAEEHLKGLAKNPDVALVGFCDINLARAEEMARKYGTDGKAFDKAKSMFENSSLDAAYFCLPPFAHGAEFEAIRRGVPFFVEKPINLDFEQARKISEAVKKKKLLTSVGYMNRYRRGVQLVRDLARGDQPILLLGGWIGGTPRAEGGAIWSWWIRKEKSGGQFLEQVTHTVDLARYICGEVSEVHAFAAKGLNAGAPEGYSIEDASVVNLKFKNGAVANLWASCSANGGGGGVSLNVYCNNMTAIFTGWEHSLRLLRKGAEPEEIKGEEGIFAIEDGAFIEAVKERDPSKVLCQYADGLKTLEITVAANQSMRTKQPVKLPIAAGAPRRAVKKRRR
ncbi:MAG: Gfo/Idh/MocA family oxidoreductase [Candidatus Brockarchaeota archaeon]|nr:Gfo/Idh/MocA family oxidoreductase [Candidatus Brockarchaeota archaeon]